MMNIKRYILIIRQNDCGMAYLPIELRLVQVIELLYFSSAYSSQMKTSLGMCVLRVLPRGNRAADDHNDAMMMIIIIQ